MEMSPLQMHTSVLYRSSYALCCVNMSGVDQNVVDEPIYPEFDDLIPRIKALTKIGDLVAQIDEVSYGSDGEVHLGGAYSCIIPQKIFREQGIGLENLIEEIKKQCQDFLSTDTEP